MIERPRVAIQVQSVYLETQSIPDQARFVFAYTVSVHNLGRFDIQLLRRYWRITDAHGRQIIVQGDGVVGEQPLILPGTEFRYTSGAVLETPCGTMEGYYEMIDHLGAEFRADIDPFRLAIPQIIN